jgi:hypothetical protein
VVAEVYRGGLDTDHARLAEWTAGAAALAPVSDRLVCFVHPADRAMLAEAGPPVVPDRLETTLTRLGADLGIEVLRWQDFDLAPVDFLDINHVNAATGRQRITSQIAQRVWQARI